MNKELESFSYAVSHDLRSPLRSIHGFSEALQQSARARLTPEETGWLDKISAAAARMDRLTEDLLRLSRISRSKLKREHVNLALLAREVVHELRETDPSRNVVFAISDQLDAHADPVLMGVAITNLLENAWKYTGKQEEGLISFSREQIDHQTVFCVRDNGAGFEMEYASKLFTPFQRLHSARDFAGSGVGLACVARVVHKHGGRIWANAAVGQGASFFFTIPDEPSAARVRMPVDRGQFDDD
jgi:signal transduction histidine kinase